MSVKYLTTHLVLGDGPDDVDRVLLGQVVDEPDGGVVEYGRVRVEAGLVEVTLAVVGPHDPAQLAVARDVEALVGREDDDAPRILTPADTVAADHDLEMGTCSFSRFELCML